MRVDEMPLAPLRRTDVRVRTHYSGISVGTERWLITGQRTDAPFPTITGYQNCGVVEEVGSMVKSVVVGERVSVGTTRVVPPIHQGWAGHVETVIADAGLVVGIPDAVSWESAALERLAAVGLRGVRMANIRYGDNVVIIGQGMIGHLLGQICRSWDANVVVAERLSMRRHLSRQWVT